MEQQYLPTYKHDFLTDSRWVVHESEHYVFRYFKKSVAEQDIMNIVETQEKAFNKIIFFLEIQIPDTKIRYYFYPNKETKVSLMGDDWYAQAILAEYCVHVLYNEEIKPIGEHEDTHLLSAPMGISIGFFQEGLAEYMVGHAWDGKSHIEYVRSGYEKRIYPALSSFFEHSAWLNTDDSQPLYFYSLAGAFATFLIDTFGKMKFFRLFKETNRSKSKVENMKCFEDIYGGFDIIEKSFKQYCGVE